MKYHVGFLGLLVLALSLPVQGQEALTDKLIQELGIRESELASREMAGWEKPAKIVVLVRPGTPETGPGSRAWMREAAGDTEIVFADGSGAGMAAVADADAYFGWCSAEALSAGTRLSYIHIYSAGIDRCMAVDGIAERGLIATNSQKAASQTIAEHSIALLLALTRNIHIYRDAQATATWSRGKPGTPDAVSIQGKTMLVLGLGGIGSQSAMRGHALGMRVIGTRNSSRSGPDYVDYVGLSDETVELAARADVVVNALPLTDSTRGSIGHEFFGNMRKGSYYISVGRGSTTDTEALMSALSDGTLAGAGLDVTDPEPLPDEHPLWKMRNVIITPHVAATSDLSRRNTLLIARENLRRYVAGEKLLNMVDLKRGY